MNVWKISTLFLLQIPWPTVAENANTGNSETKDWLKNLIPTNYTRTYPPSFTGTSENPKKITKVKLYIIPRVISSVSVKQMHFSVDMSINMQWTDDRLTPEEKKSTGTNNKINQPALPKDVAIKLWHPRIEFTNCKQCAMEVVDPHAHHFAINNKKKEITVKFRQSYLFTCQFDLTHYPFDVQTCTIDMGLMDPDRWQLYIKLRMFVQSHSVGSITVPAEFTLVFHGEDERCQSKENKLIKTCYSIKFILARSRVQHILLTFIPSMLIVCLSWISFWLEVDSSAPRVALGLTSLLTLSTQFNTSQKDLPSVATFKALDVWMFTCICMVYASLIEFGVAHNCYRLAKLKEKVNSVGKTYSVGKTPATKKIRHCCGRWIFFKYFPKRKITSISSEKIDGASKVIFPATFITFNVVFWVYYTSQ